MILFYSVKEFAIEHNSFYLSINYNFMKTFLLLAVISLLAINSFGQSNYERGFQRGYKTSYAEPIDYIQRINTSDIYSKAKILKEAKAKAFELSKIGNYQGSIDIAKAGLDVIPTDPEFMMLIGNGYLQLRNYSEALK